MFTRGAQEAEYGSRMPLPDDQVKTNALSARSGNVAALSGPPKSLARFALQRSWIVRAKNEHSIRTNELSDSRFLVSFMKPR
jgi:hypothetical protein